MHAAPFFTSPHFAPASHAVFAAAPVMPAYAPVCPPRQPRMNSQGHGIIGAVNQRSCPLFTPPNPRPLVTPTPPNHLKEEEPGNFPHTAHLSGVVRVRPVVHTSQRPLFRFPQHRKCVASRPCHTGQCLLFRRLPRCCIYTTRHSLAAIHTVTFQRQE